VDAGGTLGGGVGILPGTVGALTVSGTLSPGASFGSTGTGILFDSGNVRFASGSALDVDLNGTTAGTNYDQLAVHGNLDLSNSPTLNLSLGCTPALKDSYTIVQTAGTITGTFNGLADGSTVVVNGCGFQIHYGTNAITLTEFRPTALVSGPSVGVDYQPLTFNLGATDPVSPGFSYAVNWGDGTSGSASSPSGTQLSHAYTAAGTYTVTVTATDQAGAVSAPVTTSVQVFATPQLENSVLAIPGTASAATFTLTPVLPSGASSYSMQVTQTIGKHAVNYGPFAVSTGSVEVYGGPGPDNVVLKGPAGTNAFTLGSGTVTEQVAVGAAQATTFTVGLNSVAALTLQGGGNDTLTGPNQTNTWDLTGHNAGTLDGTPFSGMKNLTGGTAADTFTFLRGGSVSGLIDGGASGTLDYSQLTNAIAVTLVAGGTNKATFTGGWQNIAAILGSSAATNSLTGGNTSNTWDVSGANAGSLNGMTFSNFATLMGGSGTDDFVFLAGGSLSGRINGGAGSNTLDESQYGSPVTVNLATRTATGLGGTWANIQSFAATGNQLQDTLIGPNSSIIWSLTGGDSGTVGTFSFTGFADLTGGSGNDTFQFGPNGNLNGSIDGGAGTNTLSYQSYTRNVYVSLQTGIATGFHSIANIQNVTGSAVGGDVLVGNGNSNVLKVNAGNNLVIGGGGADTLQGGSGDDILIAGTTSYDQNPFALDALLATWDNTSLSYYQRVGALTQGVGYYDSQGNLQTAALDPGSTVTQPTGSKPSTLVGGGMDWFFATLADTIKNKKAGEFISIL
jgi:hypothetical protein